MEFLSIRELSKSPKLAFDKLTADGKAVITNNGQPQAIMVKVEDLPARDAGLLVRDLRAAGLPITDALSEYYHRFSFPSVSFVVMILSISMGGGSKKHSPHEPFDQPCLGGGFLCDRDDQHDDGEARLYPPLAGAWFPVMVFIALGLMLLRSART